MTEELRPSRAPRCRGYSSSSVAAAVVKASQTFRVCVCEPVLFCPQVADMH